MRCLFSLLLLALALHSFGQVTVEENKQKSFPNAIPPGNYSGVTWLGGDRYAVVSDKSEYDGFFFFEIKTDSVSGEVLSARNLGFRSSGQPNRDGEGIAYNRRTNTIFISGEADNYIKEYDIDGRLTGRGIPPTNLYRQLPGNLGLEALSYNDSTRTLWTCNESDTIYIQSYNDSLQPIHTYKYILDAPIADRGKAQFYAHGVGTICALDDGSLLLLEREFYVPYKKIGSFVNCKLYHFFPINPTSETGGKTSNVAKGQSQVTKRLLASWRTSLNLTSRSIANYEGMCVGPTLKDGSRVIILVADSQNQYRGVLKDWIKSLKLSFH